MRHWRSGNLSASKRDRQIDRPSCDLEVKKNQRYIDKTPENLIDKRGSSSTYVLMYLCTYVLMYLCTYVLMYLCTYVLMYL